MIHPNADFAAAAPASAPAPAVHRNGEAEEKSEKSALIELVRRASANDSAAQAELMHRYLRRVSGFIRGIIRQPDAVEDVAQVVFIKMFRRLSRLRDPAVFESWLFTLARNSSLDFIRRRSCRPNTVALDDQINQIADPSNSNTTTEILAALDRALARLSPIDRSLVSQFVAGETYGSIAEQAGLSLASVKVRLHRVRPFLRSWVGEMTETRQPGGKGWSRTSGSRSTLAWPASVAEQTLGRAA
jgi:RNA polymerase sigma-70 factor, ECF subfamily